MKNTRLFAVTLLSLYLTLVILQCSASGDSNTKTTVKEKSVSGTLESKLSSPIKDILTKMKAKGITANNVREFDAESLSSSLIKVDRHGNIQTYIYLTAISGENIGQLKMKQVKIELVNKEWNIVQAWIPFYRIEEVAKFHFVESITQPDYGKTLF